MDMEDRKKCSELWQMASGDYRSRRHASIIELKLT